MVDRVDQAHRSRIMQSVRTKDTGPEVEVRSILHRMGYRFRLHRNDLPGKPDIVLPRRRVVVFVHGCFWHWHGCPKGQVPKSRHEYWVPKLHANRVRDRCNVLALEEAGWRVEIVWQCELKDRAALAARLGEALSRRHPGLVYDLPSAGS